MANRLMGAFGPGSPRNGGGSDILSRFSEFKKQYSGKNPEEVVRGMLQNGQMTQEQFNQLAQQANKLQSLMGR